MSRIDAQNRNLARIARAKAFQDLNGRCLAGPVRAEQREDLATPDVEVDTRDGDVAAVRLAKAAHTYGKVVRHQPRYPIPALSGKKPGEQKPRPIALHPWTCP